MMIVVSVLAHAVYRYLRKIRWNSVDDELHIRWYHPMNTTLREVKDSEKMYHLNGKRKGSLAFSSHAM